MRKARIALALALLGPAIAAPGAQGAQILWDGGGGDGSWHTAANWSPNTVPGADDEAFLGASSAEISAADVTVGGVNIASPGRLTVDGRKLTVDGTFSHAGGDPAAGGGMTFENGATLRMTGTTRLNAITGLMLGDTDGAGSATGKIEIAGDVQVYETINEAAPGVGLVHVETGATMRLPHTLSINTELDNDGTVHAATDDTGALFYQPKVAPVTTSTGSFVIGDDPSKNFQPQLVLAPVNGTTYTVPPGGITGSGTLVVQTQSAFHLNTVHVPAGVPFNVGMLKINGRAALDLDANGLAKRMEFLGDNNNGGRQGDGSLGITGPGVSLIRGGRFSGGTTTTFGPATTLTFEGATIAGSAKVITGGTTTWPNRLAISLGGGGAPGFWENEGTTTIQDDLSDGSSGVLHAVDGGKLVNRGTFNKNGNETMSGTARIENEGTFNVNAATMGQDPGAFVQSGGATTIAAGATLGHNTTMTGGVLRGQGSVRKVDATGGTIRPGTSPGTLTVLTDLTMSAGAVLNPEITGTAAGTQFDVLDVKGAAAIGGTLTVDSAGFTPAENSTYRIVPAASRSGAFATVDAGAPGGMKYLAEYTAAGAGAGVRLCAKPTAAAACSSVVEPPPPPPDDTTPVTPGGTTPATPVTPAATPPMARLPITVPSAAPAAAVTKVEQAVTFPSTRKCASRRRFGIRLRVPRGATVTQAIVKVNGKQVAVRRGDRLRSTVNLTKLPKGRFTVAIELKLAGGKTIKGERKYRTCAPKRKGGKVRV